MYSDNPFYPEPKVDVYSDTRIHVNGNIPTLEYRIIGVSEYISHTVMPLDFFPSILSEKIGHP